jgi:hypothetical protein
MVKYGQIWLNMVRKRWSVVASAIVGVVFDQIDQKSGQKWSKMVDFKYLTTFGEIAEKSGSGKIKHAKVS